MFRPLCPGQAPRGGSWKGSRMDSRAGLNHLQKWKISGVLHYYGTLRGVGCYLVTDVSEQINLLIFKSEGVQEEYGLQKRR